VNIQHLIGLDDLVNTFRVVEGGNITHTVSVHKVTWYTVEDNVVGVQLELAHNGYFEQEDLFVFPCASTSLLAAAWRPGQGFSLSMFAKGTMEFVPEDFTTRVVLTQFVARMAAED
jgi:hypothetical protein